MDTRGFENGPTPINGGRNYLVHCFCWVLFIVYELSLTFYSYGKLEPFYVYLLFYLLNISYFYCHVALLNFAFDRASPRYFKGILLSLLLLIAYQCVKRLLDHFLYHPSEVKGPMIYLKTVVPAYLFRTTYFTILATFYWASGYLAFYKKQVLKAERQQLIIARDKAEVENALLQQQINPHMLFNALNFIYSDVYEGSPAAARSVLLLTDIVRYGMEATKHSGDVLLSEELLHISQLIEINRYRFHHALYLEFVTEGSLEGIKIIPLVLLTLTENVFKHGNLKDAAFPAAIRLSININRELRYQSRNLKKIKSDQPQTSQLGLKNIIRRLEFAYPGSYKLEITDKETYFELNLTIQL